MLINLIGGVHQKDDDVFLCFMLDTNLIGVVPTKKMMFLLDINQYQVWCPEHNQSCIDTLCPEGMELKVFLMRTYLRPYLITRMVDFWKNLV